MGASKMGQQESSNDAQFYPGTLKDRIAHLWPEHRGFIFCLAAGAVVRLVAPLLQDKSRDPAVVVIDETGKFVISLCSGHIGGADRLARLVAAQIGATPVLTGASAGLGLPGIDLLGVPFGWRRGDGDWTGVSAAAARGESIEVIQEAGSTLWQQHLPEGHPFYFNFPESRQKRKVADDLVADDLAADKLAADKVADVKARIWISFARTKFASEPELQSELPTVQWHPRVLWVGIGCERGTSKAVIEKAIERVFRDNGLAVDAIAGIATIDLKADEVGLLEICQERNWPLRTFSAEVLRSLRVPTPSEIVNKEVGTPSVAEAAAIVAALEAGSAIAPAPNPNSKKNSETTNRAQNSKLEAKNSKGEAFRQKLVGEADSLSPECFAPTTPSKGEAFHQNVCRGEADSLSPEYLAPTNILVSKQIFRLEGQAGAATIAVAQGEREYTGRQGKLLLVGIGPGQLEQMTPAAQTAVTGADAIIGYSLYINLISPLLRPGQIVESLPIAQERQRAERAIALANWGLTVAVVSSGDAGIYGMAGLVLEQLRAENWDGQTPGVEVFPGITALQATASRLGAPLMHDFCAISLSDLLTPWPVIEKRLEAAARADFVTALYNPRSQTRTEQIGLARKIFLEYRDAQTPVAIARSVYREQEQITVTTLEKMLDFTIDMLSTVLIGNQSTGFYENWLITPRGYLGFEKNIEY